MITATHGMNLQHGWVRGYSFVPYTGRQPAPAEWRHNHGIVLILMINNEVQAVWVTYKPLAEMLLNPDNSLIDASSGEQKIISIVNNETGVEIEQVHFDNSDELIWALLASSPQITEAHPRYNNNSLLVNGPGWRLSSSGKFEIIS